MKPITIVECPRDAWQGLPQHHSRPQKRPRYLRALVDAGFRHIDAVSFVSPKHVPQMADSEAVMKSCCQLPLPSGRSARKSSASS